jgi:chaperonin GroEL
VYENAGIDANKYLDYVIMSQYGSGIDIDTEEKVNLFDIGVIDPTKVSRLALENAVSVVSLFTSLGASSFNSEPLMQMS